MKDWQERALVYLATVTMLIIVGANLHSPTIKVYDCQGATQQGEVK